MKLFRILSVLCFLTIPALSLDREAFTLTNYDLEIRVEPAQQRLSGRGKIMLRNDSTSPQKNLVLQVSSSLDWRSIQFEGKALQFVSQPYTSDIDHTGGLSEAVVTLPREVAPQGTIELEVGYEGVVPLDATRLSRIGISEDTAKSNDWDQVSKSFSAVRGVGYVTWYPVSTESASLTEGGDVFDTLGRWKDREKTSRMRLRLCVTQEGDSPGVVVVNADTTTATGTGCGVGTNIAASALPSTVCGDEYTFSLATAAPAFAIAPYLMREKDHLSVYYLPDHTSGAGDYTLALDLTTPFITDWFGSPRGKARIVDLANAQAAPFEAGSILFTPLFHQDSRLAQMTLVHQLTHAALPSPRPWIYEGLAHFAQAAYRENQSGRQAALDFMGLHRTALAEAEKNLAEEKRTNTSTSESLVNTSTEEFYRSKAMYVWWMLRDMIGEPTLKKALANYHADQDKEPSYLQRLLEAQSQRDLESFFDEWVYRDRGLPDFKIDSVIQRETLGGGSVVTVTVANLGDVGAEVPVTLRMEGGESTKRLQVNAKSKASIRIEAASRPHDVVVNDGSVPESNMSNNMFNVNTAEK